ncbi:hypothetical protein FFH90_022210 [Pseudomonas sp. ATCC 43928]|nr:hypothetical protein FFH90_022210 [Pseudomonas sp. ATCC 43928]
MRYSQRFLWRGSLLPLGCEATPKPALALHQAVCVCLFASAAQPSGTVRRSDKLPRHRAVVKIRYVNTTLKCRVSDSSPCNSAFGGQIR